MIRPFEHGGNIYRHAGGRPVLDFSANINPLGLAEGVRNAIAAHLDDVIHYPDPDCTALREALSRFYHFPVESIVPGNGAAELLYLYFHHFHFRRVCIPVPAFSEYERAARSAGAEIVYAYLEADKAFQPDLTAIASQVKDADCIVLGNPNNPTGNLIRRQELIPFLERAAQRGQFVIVDESFLDFRDDGPDFTVADFASQSGQVFVIHSLTKFYALPGLRLGFGIAPEAVIQGLMEQTDVWHVNTLAQTAGIEALAETAYQKASRTLVREERDWMSRMLSCIPGVTICQPSVNFILCHIRQTGLTATVLAGHMQEQGILIRDCSNYPGLDSYYIRLAVRSREENEYVVETIKACLKNKS